LLSFQRHGSIYGTLEELIFWLISPALLFSLFCPKSSIFPLSFLYLLSFSFLTFSSSFHLFAFLLVFFLLPFAFATPVFLALASTVSYILYVELNFILFFFHFI